MSRGLVKQLHLWSSWLLTGLALAIPISWLHDSSLFRDGHLLMRDFGDCQHATGQIARHHVVMGGLLGASTEPHFDLQIRFTAEIRCPGYPHIASIVQGGTRDLGICKKRHMIATHG